MIYILYNPLSNNGHGYEDVSRLKSILGVNTQYTDITTIDTKKFYQGLDGKDEIILSGGDGTINRFINDIYDVESGIRVRYFKSGCGNDFANDVKNAFSDGFVALNPYMKNLPMITVNGRKQYFLNGIGYGVDGYCCEKSDELKKKSGRRMNYSVIALRGLFFDYKPCNAVVTVDGKRYHYTHVLMSPVMKGRYYGGGIMIAPAQNRLGGDGSVTVVTVHDLGKLKALGIFPKIYSGKHIKHTDVVAVHTGHEITVEFEKPTPLQIDGETVSGVTRFTVESGADRDNAKVFDKEIKGA